MIRVTVDDVRLAPYRNVRDRDLCRAGELLAEGESVLRVLLSSASLFHPLSLLLCESRLEKLAPLLSELSPHVPVYVLSQREMNDVVGFPIHRGILAHATRGPTQDAHTLLRAPGLNLAVAALSIVNHDNVGGIFRAAAAFGAGPVLLDAVTCDPLYRKSIRVSVGGALRVPFARLESTHQVVDELLRANFELLALSPRGTEALADVRPGPRTAILLGSEEPGLSDEVMMRARTVRIPMAPGFDSLNVAVAGAIALHHLRQSE